MQSPLKASPSPKTRTLRADRPAGLQKRSSADSTASEGSSGSVLGSIAESSSTPEEQAFKARFRRLKTARQLLPGERIEQCLCTVAPLAKYVRAQFLDGEKKASRFMNLIRCESSGCPVCAHGRAQRDRAKFVVMLSQAQQQDLNTVLLSLTLRHHQGNTLDELLDALLGAWDKMWSGRRYDDLAAEYGIVSKVRILEETYGEHGHHPHIHSPLFMTEKLYVKPHGCPECGGDDVLINGNYARCNRLEGGRWCWQGLASKLVTRKTLAEFEAKLKARWAYVLAKEGFDATWAHGLNVEIADSKVADYLTKWGMDDAAEHENLMQGTWGAESELALLPTKNQTEGGLTPFGLLAAATGEEWAVNRLSELTGLNDRDELIKRAGGLYREYFYAFKRVARVYIPPKLTKLLDLKNALARWNELHPVETDWTDMLLIERGPDWNDVWKRNLEAELLLAVRTGNPYHVESWAQANGIKATVPNEAKRLYDKQKVAALPATKRRPTAARVPGVADRPKTLTLFDRPTSMTRRL